MKQLKKLVIKGFSVLLVVFCVVTLIACTNDSKPSISVTAPTTTIKQGENVKLSVAVKNSDDITYEFTISDPSLLRVNNNTVSVLKSVDKETKVLITVSLVNNTEVSDSIEFTVQPTLVGTVDLEVTCPVDTLKYGESTELSVSVSGTANKEYTITSSWPKGISIEDNKITVTGKVVLDRSVTITVTSKANTSVSKSVTIIVKAGTKEGEQVGELTSAMIEEIGNESITITGSIEDIYVDFNQSSLNSNQKYNLLVQMEKDAWVGQWYNVEKRENVITDNYRKGATDGLKNQYGEVGHGLEKLYIDKNNKVATTLVKDYLSIPTIWESQHLWNHLGQLNISKFTYNEDDQAYEYNINTTDEDDLWLMTYLSYSLTPMLSDTLAKLQLVVENGHITKVIGRTEVLYYGADTQEDADAMSYTTLEVTLSGIGTTKVASPVAYEIPEENKEAYKRLENALQEMVNLKNYTIKIEEIEEYAPSGDETDYQTLSVASAPVAKKANPINNALKNYLSSTGTVGCLGWVTADAIVLAKTGKYSYAMDDKLYHTEYSGYKQVSEDSFDYFEYDTSLATLVGKRKYNGNMFDNMPKFDLSAAVFEHKYSMTSQGVTTDTFVLRDSSITRAVALELCMRDYAEDGDASTSTTLQVTVNSEGHITEVVIPYSIMDTYYGYYKVKYSNFETTVIEENAFDGYVPREIKQSWSEYMTKYYTETGSSKDTHEERTDIVLEAIYGKDVAAYFPLPELFVRVFGDAISGPFYDYDEVGSDAAGNPIYRKSLAINIASGEVDENNQITNYDELIAALTEVLLSEGFEVSQANTDTSGGESGRATRYICYIKDDIQIVVENIYTKYFYFSFYKTGEWTLKRSE